MTLKKFRDLLCALQGLCGTFTGIKDDDLTLPGGDKAKSTEAFVSSWQISETCSSKPEFRSPCDGNPRKKKLAEEKCAALMGDLFKRKFTNTVFLTVGIISTMLVELNNIHHKNYLLRCVYLFQYFNTF